MADDYYRRCAKGDFVRLPNGRTGTIVNMEFRCGGHSKHIVVRLDKDGKKKRFHDGQIDELELICTEKELELIGSESPNMNQQG